MNKVKVTNLIVNLNHITYYLKYLDKYYLLERNDVALGDLMNDGNEFDQVQVDQDVLENCSAQHDILHNSIEIDSL